MYYGKWEAAINTLKKHLELPNATWRDERCASIRFIARCYSRLNQITESRNWCDKPINEAPYTGGANAVSAHLVITQIA